MAQEETGDSPAIQGLDRQQLEIYATEIQRQFQQQRRLRGELEQRNQDLEQRVRELQALNNLFQQHMAERSAADEASRCILGKTCE